MRTAIATSIVASAILAAAAPQPAEQTIGMVIPIIKRSALVNDDKIVNVDTLDRHIAAVKAKMNRGLINFEQNTGSPHPSALQGSHRRRAAKAGVPLTDFQEGTFWYGKISIGTPAKSFTVDFDTGSSDLFVPAPSCDSFCEGHTRYDPKSSSTSHNLTWPFSLVYADNSTVSGVQFTDNVSIGGHTATNQTFDLATTYSSTYNISDYPADGLMGMAFQSIASNNASPVFQTLVDEKKVSDPVFSFKLTDTGAELYIGGSNHALYTGKFTYADVRKEGYWEVTMDSIEANGRQSAKNLDVIIDTGTTLVVGPPSAVADLYKTIGGKLVPQYGPGVYGFPCDSFPNISFSFGGKSFSGPGLNLGISAYNSSECVSGIVGQDTGLASWIIGDAFLTGVYTQFDFGKSRVGFAELA